MLSGVVLFLLGGCGGDSDNRLSAEDVRDPAQEESLRPCRLLTRADVESAVGGRIKPGAPHRSTPPVSVVGMRHCTFASANGVGGVGPIVYVGLASQFAREAFDKYKSGPSSNLLQPVTGVGTEAVYSHFGANHSLVVLDGGRVVAVSLAFVQKDPRQTAEALARKAIAKPPAA